MQITAELEHYHDVCMYVYISLCVCVCICIYGKMVVYIITIPHAFIYALTL